MRPTSSKQAIVLIALALAATSRSALAEPPDPIFAAVREAVAAKRVDGSEVVGFNLGPAVVRDEPPESGILVGFDLGLGERLGHKTTVYSLRPLYLTPNGVKPSQTFGLAQGRTGKGKNPPRSKVSRTITIQAKPGYAVGAVMLDTGLTIDAMAITFMRITGASLDPNDAYTCDWIGSREEKKARIVTWNGDPIVGVLARENDTHIIALGLVRMRPAESEPEARPPQKARPAAPPAADGAAKTEDKGGPPAGAKPAPAAPAEAAAGDGEFPWLSLAVFVVVSVTFLGVAMLVLRLRDAANRGPEQAEADPRKRRRRRRQSKSAGDPKARPETEEDVPEVLPADDEGFGAAPP